VYTYEPHNRTVLTQLYYEVFFGLVREVLLRREGSVSTVDLLVLTCLDLFYMENIFFYKTSYLNEEVGCTVPSPSVSILWISP
jgi:hypothetical protein